MYRNNGNTDRWTRVDGGTERSILSRQRKACTVVVESLVAGVRSKYYLNDDSGVVGGGAVKK